MVWYEQMLLYTLTHISQQDTPENIPMSTTAVYRFLVSRDPTLISWVCQLCVSGPSSTHAVPDRKHWFYLRLGQARR